MKRNIADTILLFILILIVIVAIGFSMGMHSLTVIDWWKPVVVCGVIALPVSILLAKYMKRLTCCIFKYLEYPAAFVLSFSIILAAFYSSNYFLSDASSGYEYHASVVKKYRAERTRSKRIGRRTYGQEKYTVYFIEIEMKDGKLKKLEKSYQEYNRIKKGSSINLFIEDGLFKIPVIKHQQNK